MFELGTGIRKPLIGHKYITGKLNVDEQICRELTGDELAIARKEFVDLYGRDTCAAA